MNVVCKHCKALHWDAEKLASSTKANVKFGLLCCCDGNTSLPDWKAPPPLLHEILTTNQQDAKLFRENVRRINQAFSFVSVGVNLDEQVMRATGPFCFS